MEKKYKILGMSYEEYQERKQNQIEKAFMKAMGWKENEYIKI